MTAAQEAAAWRSEMTAGVERIHEEGGGAISLYVVQPVEIPGLLGRVLAGEVAAGRILTAATHAVRNIEQAPRQRPMLCACCPRSLRKTAYALAIAIPASDRASQALGIAICARCAADNDDVAAKAVLAFRKIWPDLHSVVITHPAGGRA